MKVVYQSRPVGENGHFPSLKIEFEYLMHYGYNPRIQADLHSVSALYHFMATDGWFSSSHWAQIQDIAKYTSSDAPNHRRNLLRLLTLKIQSQQTLHLGISQATEFTDSSQLFWGPHANANSTAQNSSFQEPFPVRTKHKEAWPSMPSEKRRRDFSILRLNGWKHIPSFNASGRPATSQWQKSPNNHHTSS